MMTNASEDEMANVGTPDRIIRVIVGAVLILLPFITGWAVWTNMIATIAAVAVGVVLIVTAAIRFCPIYAALRLSTNKTAQR